MEYVSFSLLFRLTLILRVSLKGCATALIYIPKLIGCYCLKRCKIVLQLIVLLANVNTIVSLHSVDNPTTSIECFKLKL